MATETPDEQAPSPDNPETTPGQSATVYSRRLRHAAGVLFLLTGALGLLLGVVLLGYAVLGGFAGVPPVTIALFALPTLVVGAIQIYGGWAAWRGRRWRAAVGAGVVGLLFSPNPVLVPVKVVALVFLGITEDQFA